MLHWTPLPDDLIFNDSAEPPVYYETIYEGVPLLVESVGKGVQVVRILSPDPAHFLDPRFQPGMMLVHR
jgi:hypothetical protein